VVLEAGSPAPIVVTVGDAAACVECPDPELHESMTGLFRHCTGSLEREARVRFSVIRSSNDTFQLGRDGRRLYEGDDLDYLSHFLLHQLMISLIRGCVAKLSLHAAALARNGSGLLLCGESASGKSTLSAWLTASGFDYLTDELAVVELDGRRMTGLARSIMLRRDSVFVLEHWLGEGFRPPSSLFAGTSIAVDPEILRPRSVCRSAQPGMIVFPRYRPGEPLTGRRLSAAETTRRILQVATNAARLPQSGIPAILALARSVDAFSFDYPEAESAAAWIETKVGA